MRLPKAWFTSDTHFNHLNIIPYCSRPWPSLDTMNAGLIANWNEVVEDGDTVYHLGDFAMGQRTEHEGFYRQLKGKKILIRGNHDSDRTANLFDEVYEEYYVTNPFGVTVWLAHVPIDNGGDPRGYSRPPATQPYDFALCGHVHSEWTVKAGCINVGVDMWNYRPHTLSEILFKLGNRVDVKV